ncbi:MAG TPA: S-methyl-5'-thioadenosine phosphorylase [Acidimicrobiia bacterium]|nr:S-methyl-5'-thioadenosine phosphorylase [Acidimicrobiia bacterium]
MGDERAEIGIFGGSGFYSFLEGATDVELSTPFGAPSAPITVGDLGGRRVAFLPRHGRQHQFAPHAIPARANVWALRALGVHTVLGPCAAGSLTAPIAPGDFVVVDQLVDRTWGRADTFYDAGATHHVTFADPYCPVVREVAIATARATGVTVHDRGTMVVINGPRFSTRAESRWFRAQGWEVVGMTQYPEAALVRELGLHYGGIALITDYDTGVEDDPGIDPVSHDQVLAAFEANLTRVREVLTALVPALPAPPTGCSCAQALGPLHPYE